MLDPPCSPWRLHGQRHRAVAPKHPTVAALVPRAYALHPLSVPSHTYITQLGPWIHAAYFAALRPAFQLLTQSAAPAFPFCILHPIVLAETAINKIYEYPLLLRSSAYTSHNPDTTMTQGNLLSFSRFYLYSAFLTFVFVMIVLAAVHCIVSGHHFFLAVRVRWRIFVPLLLCTSESQNPS